MSAWRRHGLCIPLKSNHSWWASHAQAPAVLPLGPHVWRIYFNARNSENRLFPVAFDVDPEDSMRVIAEHLAPLLPNGPVGRYDHTGVVASCAIRVGEQIRLYTTGVHIRADVRFETQIGLAHSDDGLAFSPTFAGPVRSTGAFDPYFVSSPCVRACAEGFRMWYVSGTSWQIEGDSLEPEYDIRTCVSADGLFWETNSSLAVSASALGASGLARPWVTETPAGGRLWSSARGAAFRNAGKEAYRMFSQPLSPQGIALGDIELVEFENPPASTDFDSWMQCYPCVVQHGDTEVMFYNGNDFGRDGVGWATRPRTIS